MIVDLGFRPRVWQTALFAGMKGKRFCCLVVHRRGGKTVAAIIAIITRALQSKRRDGRFAYVAPLLKQARAVAWDYLKHYAAKIPKTKINESESWVEFPNGSRIRLYGADNPDSLRGIYLDGVILDEVAQMKPEVWGEIIRPALADRNGWALFIGTPKGVNLFSDIYYRALQDEEWFAALYTVEDTGALPDEEKQRIRAELSENEWRQEFLCDFMASSDDNLIPISLAEDASRRHIRSEQYDFAPKILGVDVAFADDGDRSVIFPRQGLAAFNPKVYQGMKNMALADEIARSIDKWGADATFVDIGRGEGVIDRLCQMGYNPLPVNFGGVPANVRYLNKRTEMWFLMAKWIEDGGGIPDIPDLKRDLCTPKYDSNNAANRLQLERKEKIKERGLKSPDLGDALALTFAFPVVKARQDLNFKPNLDYDPRIALDNSSHVKDYATFGGTI